MRGRIRVTVALAVAFAVGIAVRAPIERPARGAEAAPLRRPSAEAKAFVVQAQAVKSKKGKAKGRPKAKSEPSEPKKPPTPVAVDESAIKFSRDIAPILVGNCIECHNPDRRRGKFDLTTFEKLMTGTNDHKVIVPGKPEESHLVLHLKGDEDPKMPPGNRELAMEAVAKIEAWVKAGAVLDAGIDPQAQIKTVAPSAEDRRRAELAKLTPQQRDQKLEAAAKERWKKSGAKEEPEMTSGPNFVLFARLPRDRASQVLKVLEAEAVQVNRIMGRPNGQPTLDLAEKVSVYVFNEPGHYVEFARSVENRETGQSTPALANLAVEAPYIAAADPLGGREDESLKRRSAGRSKKSDDSGGPERSLAGLLAEQFGAAAVAQAGKPPRWLSLGMGAYLASQVEPRSPYYRHLRQSVAQEYALGWKSKATEGLGDQTDAEKVKAIGFSLVEWLSSTDRRRFSLFATGMLDGPEKLDDGIRALWGGASRDQFLDTWGQWIATHYGTRGR